MRHILIGAIIVGAGLAGWAGEATRSAVEPAAVVEQVRRLGDRSGEVRAGAVSRLVRMGKEALPELVKALGAEGEEERAAAAEAIRKILANDPTATADGRHDRAFWEKRLGQVRAGMSWDEAVAVLFPEMTAAERGNVRAGGVGDSFAAVRVVRLDGYWSAQIYVRGTRDSTVTRPPMLSGRNASVFVQAPAGYTGVWTTWFVNGQKASETNYRDGRRDGTVTRFFDDGVNKSSETHFVQGVNNGPYREWFRDGRDRVVGSFKDGKRDGRWTMRYENGEVRSVEELKDGLREGLYASWYRNGQKQWEEHYANGKKEGLDCYWDENGKQLWQRAFRAGRLVEDQAIARPKAAAEKPAPPVAEPPPQRGATVSEIEARMRERRGRDLAIERFQRMGVEAGIDRTRTGSPVVSLDLSHKDIGDFDLTYVAMLPQLETLNLSETKVTDAGLKHLGGLSGLETLHLSGTQVTDAGLDYLKNLTHLKMVMVLDTNVTQRGAAELRRVLPNVIVGGARRGATTAPAVDPDVQEIERRIRERRMRELMPEAAPVPATRPAGDVRRDGEDEVLRHMRERRAREMRGEMSAAADDELLRQHLLKGTEAGATTQPAVVGTEPAENDAAPLPNAVIDGKSSDFDAWIDRIVAGPNKTRAMAALAEQAVRARLTSERYTSHHAVKVAVGTWVTYCGQDAIANPAREKRESRYKEAIRCIDGLLVLLESIDGSSLLRADFCLLKEMLLRNDDLTEARIKAAEDALRILEPVRTEADRLVVPGWVSLADALLRQGDKKNAEKEYMSAVLYRWYLVKDVQVYHLLRDQYRHAVRSVMDLRRGDSKGLRQLELVFNANDGGADLKKELDELIRDAEGK